MTTFISNETDLTNFTKYAQFVLENHLAEVSQAQLKISRENKLPLLQLFAHLTEEELVLFFEHSFKEFLNQVLERRVLSAVKETVIKWKANKLEGIPKDKIGLLDIILSYSGRKQALFNFLPKYSDDPAAIVAIVSEIDKLYSQMEAVVLEAYVEIQYEELKCLNFRLIEYQEELQATNEELKESHEELQVTIEELNWQTEESAVIERALEKERNYFRAVLENVSDGIVACNEHGILSFLNDATREFHGLPTEALPAENWASYYDLYQADGKTLLQKEEIPLFKAFRGEKVKNAEIVIAPANGKKRLLVANGRQIRSSEGEIMGAVVVMQDVTEQKEAEREIYESNMELAQALEELQSAEEQLVKANHELEKRVQQRTDELSASKEELRQTLENALELNKTIEEREHFLSSILDQTPISTWISDAEGTQIRVNEACMKLFGIDDPTLGIGKYNILKDNVLIDQPFFEDIKKVFTEGKVATIELDYNINEVEQLNISTGRNVTLVTTIFPIKDANGKITNAVIQHEDVTQRKKAERDLIESETLFRTVANAAPVGLWMSDEEGEINYVNQTWIDWTGRSFDNQLGQGWSLTIVLEDRAYVREKFAQDFQKRAYYRVEYRIIHQDGQTHWCVAEGVPRYLTSGEFAGYVGSVMDITDRKKAEGALQAKNRELEKINADLDNFVYTASHDLKAPISNIEGLTSLLKGRLDGRLESSEEKILEMIEVSIARFKRTIVDLTEVTKVQKDFEEEVEEIIFKEALEDVKKDIKDMIEQSGALIRENLQIDSLTYARRNLRSILYNLLSNSIKYASPDRPLEIDITTYQEGESIILCVKDNGLGMSEKNLGKLFSMFKRFHKHVEGTGIGLYMIKRIIENKGGTIEVRSQLNVGTEFKICFLPIVKLSECGTS